MDPNFLPFRIPDPEPGVEKALDSGYVTLSKTNVVDPDPYVFGPPGSATGSVIR
jgi:hypothetical protein